MKTIPSIKLPIIQNEEISNEVLSDIMANKKVVIFGVPGAFTPTCSEKHLPGFLKLSEAIKAKGVDEIYCLSVNDAFVMSSWLLSYTDGDKINGIADGNGEVSTLLNVSSDKSANFMGIRCTRFAMIIDDNCINNIFIEEAGKLEVSSAENILKEL